MQQGRWDCEVVEGLSTKDGEKPQFGMVGKKNARLCVKDVHSMEVRKKPCFGVV